MVAILFNNGLSLCGVPEFQSAVLAYEPQDHSQKIRNHSHW